MRLYSTLARDSSNCPTRPAPIGMYVCGPTVYARAHIGNARPYVLAAWYKRWLRERGYDVTLVPQHHGRQRQDLRGCAGASAERARRGDRAGTSRTSDASASTRPDHWPNATEIDGPDHPVHRGTGRRGATRTRSRATSTSASLAGRSTGASRASEPDQVEEQEPNPRQGGPARLRALEGEQAGRGHLRGTRRGAVAGPAGTSSARRWRTSCSGRSSRSTAAGSTSSSRITRTSSRSRARSGTSFAKLWMHNGMLRFTGEKMSKSLGNIATIQEVDRRVGAGDGAPLLPHRALAQPHRLLGGDDGRRPGAVAQRFQQAVYENRRSSACSRMGGVRGGARRRLQHGTRRSPCSTSGVPRASSSFQRGLEVFGLGFARRNQHRRTSRAARLQHVRPRELEATSRRRTTYAIEIARARLGRPRHADGYRSSSPDVTRELVYGRRPVRGGDARPARGARGVGDRARARLRGRGYASVPRVHVKPDREIGEAAETRDHQGVLAWCEPYRVRGCPRARKRPAPASRLPRSGHGSTQPGRGDPERRRSGSDRASSCRRTVRARVTPAVCRASAGAVEHLPVAVVPNLARYLNEIKRGDLWIYAASAEAEQDMWSARPHRRACARLRRRGQGVRPLVRRACDAAVSIPLAGNVESLNVSVAAALLLYEARRRQGWLTRLSTSSTATTCCTRDRSPTSAS